jgi:tetratricopeptide (TPR) repeat protein
MKFFGKNHIKYAVTLQNLCITLNSLGEIEKAKEGYLKVLEIKRKFYGEEHVKYAINLQNLCVTLEKLGENEKAIEGY